MMKLKNLIVAGALGVAMSLPAFANEGQVEVLPMAQDTAADVGLIFETDATPMQLAALSSQEMKETEGAVAPLVAIGFMTASRFIAQRYVTQSVAREMVRRGATNVMAATRSQARNIAGRSSIREFHPGAGARYTHYHPASRNGSHVWYGRAR